MQPFKQLRWKEVNSGIKPQKRWGHASCVVADSSMVIFGGYADDEYMNDLWEFDTNLCRWSKIECLGDVPSPRSQSTLNYDPRTNDLLLFGGGSQNRQRFNDLYVLDFSTKRWQKIEIPCSQKSPEPRTYHTSELIGKYLFVFGGEGVLIYSDFWVLDIDSRSWQQVALESEIKVSERRFHSSAVWKSHLMIFGGCFRRYEICSTSYIMDLHSLLETGSFEGLRWQELQLEGLELATNRWGHSTVFSQLSQKIYLFGGRSDSHDRNDFFQIDMEAKRVRELPTENTPKPRRKQSMALIGSSLLSFGGYNGSYFNDLQSTSVGLRENFQVILQKDSVLRLQTRIGRSNHDKDLIVVRQKDGSAYYVPKEIELSGYFRSVEQLAERLSGMYEASELDRIFYSLSEGHQVFSEFQSLFQDQKFRSILLRTHYKSQKEMNVKITKKLLKLLQNEGPKQLAEEQGPNPEETQQRKTFTKVISGNIIEVDCSSDLKALLAQVSEFQQKTFAPFQSNSKVHVLLNGKRLSHCFKIDSFQVLYRSQYMANIIKHSPRLSQKNGTFYQIFLSVGNENPTETEHTSLPSKYQCRVIDSIQIVFLYMKTGILIVPKTWPIEELRSIAEVADYWCIRDLKQEVCEYIAGKVLVPTLQKQSESSLATVLKLATDLKVQRFLEQTVQLLIRQQLAFFVERQSKKEEPTNQKFTRFKQYLLTSLSQCGKIRNSLLKVLNLMRLEVMQSFEDEPNPEEKTQKAC